MGNDDITEGLGQKMRNEPDEEESIHMKSMQWLKEQVVSFLIRAKDKFNGTATQQ